MRGSMVDIQFPTAEIRRGKKKKEELVSWSLTSLFSTNTAISEMKKKEEITGQKYNGMPYYIGRP